ncbi:MFS transporter [Nocardia brasiliensis]|uniref:MFS transporter n=1 Tax=Nocardia brasiliensis TaxID=37326 RepID=UPI003D904118
MFNSGIARAQRDQAPATRRAWLGLAVITTAQLLIIADASIINIALPAAQQALHISDVNRQWGVSSYVLAVGALLLLGGRVADFLGRRRAFVIGLIGFAAASLVAGLAQHQLVFFFSRAAQGVSAALLTPAALALLASIFTEPAARAKALGIYGAATSMGGILGLLAGGLLTSLASWRWCMVIATPIALLGAVGAVFSLPESRTDGDHHFDLFGALAASLGVVSLIYCIGAFENGSVAQVLSTGALAVVALTIFVVWQRRNPHPLLPLRIVFDRMRGVSLLSVLLSAMALTAVFLLLSFYLQRVLGYSAIASAGAFVPCAAVATLSSIATGRLLPRFGARAMITTGLTISAAAMLLLTQIGVSSNYWLSVLPALLLIGVGVGPTLVSASAAVLSRIPASDSGIAGATYNVANELGTAFGAALLSTIAAAATRHSDTTAATAETQGYAVAFGCSAVLLLAGAALAVALLREKR